MKGITFLKFKYPFLFNFNIKFSFILANLFLKSFDLFYSLKNISFTEKSRINKSIKKSMVYSF